MRTPIRCLCVCLGFMILLPAGCGRPRPRPPRGNAATQEISASGNSVGDVPPITLDADDWPAWRGARADGVASAGTWPTHWSATGNVVWKTALPGRGHASPIIVGGQIYLETADEAELTQSVLCLNRTDGSIVWQKEIHRGNLERQMHHENTQASSTLAWDGRRLFAVFLNDRKVWLTSLDAEGNMVWQKDVGDFVSKFGFSGSPTLFDKYCYVAADHSSGGFIAALHRESGDIVWRKARDPGDSYASPRVIELGGKPQLILGGTRQLVSYDPHTGDRLWSAKGTAEAVVGTAVTAGPLVFASGGYPEAETIAVTPEGQVAWRKNVKSYVPSLLADAGHVYLANDDGVVLCWDAATGKERWKHRIGENFRVSPLLAGGNIYVTSMSGKTTVFRASPEGYTEVAVNQLGTEAFASPAASRGQLFYRVADKSGGSRQEFLYCIGSGEAANR